jgi:hypothetical protein
MATHDGKQVTGEDLRKCSLSELDEIIARAREVRKEKVIPSAEVKACEKAISKHVRWTLSYIRRLHEAEGVPPAKLREVEKLLSKVQLSNYLDEARKVDTHLRKKPVRN